MRNFALALLALALAACSAGAGLAAVNLIARFGSYARTPDLAYGEDSAQRLDLYVPSGANRAPVVVFLHGGRWTDGHKEEYRFVGQALSSRGIVVAVAGYRHFPEVEFPGFVDDAARAVVWTHANVARYGGDPEALFVMGHSSGAHMAALVALDPSYLERAGGSASWLRGMIGLSGPYDFDPRRDDTRHVFDSVAEADLPTTQPIHYVGATRVPLLLMYGESDDVVNPKNIVNLTAAARAAGQSACAIYLPGIDHAGIVAALARPLRGRAPVLENVARFVAGKRESGAVPADLACR